MKRHIVFDELPDIAQPFKATPLERAARGKEGRKRAPRSSHAPWAPAAGRPDPVALLEEQAADRVAELVPIRYGRMLDSPGTFYRGGGADHGVGPRRHARLGLTRPAVRRRAPPELRALPVARAAARLRHQRLRRDAARAVGVGREAPGCELRDRRRGTVGSTPPTRRAIVLATRPRLPRGDARDGREARHRRLVRASGRGPDPHRSSRRSGARTRSASRRTCRARRRSTTCARSRA